jgi:hypothetical protein
MPSTPNSQPTTQQQAEMLTSDSRRLERAEMRDLLKLTFCKSLY